MIVLVDYSLILQAIQTVGILVGIFYYIMTLRNQNKTRQAQIYVQIYNKFSDPDFLERYYDAMSFKPRDTDEYVKTLESRFGNDNRKYAELVSVGTTLEGIGVLVKRGFIDPRYIADTMGTLIVEYWEDKEHLFFELRKRWNNPRIYPEIEHLYKVVSEIVYKEHPEMKPQ